MTEQTTISKHMTCIPGFDLISEGGLPQGRTTLVSGTAGSAKTVFAVQFLARGITEAKENGVFVTFEESPADIARNMRGFGWDLLTWESEGKLAFVDASPQPDEQAIVAGSYDFGALLSRIEYAIKKVNAKRISMDSLAAVFHSVYRERHRPHRTFPVGRSPEKNGHYGSAHGRAHRGVR